MDKNIRCVSVRRRCVHRRKYSIIMAQQMERITTRRHGISRFVRISKNIRWMKEGEKMFGRNFLVFRFNYHRERMQSYLFRIIDVVPFQPIDSKHWLCLGLYENKNLIYLFLEFSLLKLSMIHNNPFDRITTYICRLCTIEQANRTIFVYHLIEDNNFVVRYPMKWRKNEIERIVRTTYPTPTAHH